MKKKKRTNQKRKWKIKRNKRGMNSEKRNGRITNKEEIMKYNGEEELRRMKLKHLRRKIRK